MAQKKIIVTGGQTVWNCGLSAERISSALIGLGTNDCLLAHISWEVSPPFFHEVGNSDLRFTIQGRRHGHGRYRQGYQFSMPV